MLKTLFLFEKLRKSTKENQLNVCLKIREAERLRDKEKMRLRDKETVSETNSNKIVLGFFVLIRVVVAFPIINICILFNPF